ncbi:MAG TPA: UxaA family hydrolase [Deltaproteobacteria bacterium]|nr:UxaA family hydrolase [Deltaproteobacteria bacterium]HPJ94256.1 UxaA family hydrolase [Deltaproteobacteria bacterium]HPR51484.1 UxaA family hydrolase [Deltaproteobacteria bacterium]
MKPNVIIINPQDNVAVALFDIPEGSPVLISGDLEFPALEDIPFSHKVAVKDIPAGKTVRKYGESIGCAGEDIRQGSWVHTHNLKTEGGRV